MKRPRGRLRGLRSLVQRTQRLLARGSEPRRRADVRAIFGLGNSGGSDIARFKDEYVGEAVEAEYERETGQQG